MTEERWSATIGLEVHVQVQTHSKLFCSCPNAFGQEPNTLICPICTGHPGTLPSLNEEALKKGVLAAAALGCEIPPSTAFDRKHYFYPDLPKGYQITQLDLPIGRNGRVEIRVGAGQKKIIAINRIHLEEDAGKSTHDDDGMKTRIDFNRAGVPLLEIVSEPEIRSPEEAVVYLAELKRIIRGVGVSTCDMEKGSLRVDVNVSIRPSTESPLGTKVEIKNLNSFRNVEHAIREEMIRQEDLLKIGKCVSPETRSFNRDEGQSRAMRAKEEREEYGYSPEPDLPIFELSSEFINGVRQSIPESPLSRGERYRTAMKLNHQEASLLTSERWVSEYFEECVERGLSPKIAVNWIRTSVLTSLNEFTEDWRSDLFTPERLIELIQLHENGTLSMEVARRIASKLPSDSRSPLAIAQELNLLQVSSPSELYAIVESVIEAEHKIVGDYKEGKTSALNALLGKVMRETQGKANPKQVKEILLRILSS